MKVKNKDKPAAFHSAMQSRSDKKKQGRVRNSNAGTMMKKRSDSLLVEYRRLRKANSFVDNRIGEKDDTLAPEEKALLRFRAQKLRGKKHSKYDLGEDEHEGGLGELGVAIDHDEEGRRDYMGTAEADESETLLEKLKGELPGRGNRKKTKREVMREVISKSKFHRFEKSRQREEDQEEQENLDEKFDKLLQGNKFSGVVLSPPEKLLQGISKKGENPSDEMYDGLTKQLATDMTVMATDRTETPEEIEAKKKKATERAKAKRERRMMADSEEEEDLQEEGDIPEGGYAARRKRQKLREEAELREQQQQEEEEKEGEEELDGYGALGDDDVYSDPSGEDEDINALERRRRNIAAGDDPLQIKFRALTESLLSKLNNKGEADENEPQKGKKETDSSEHIQNGEVSPGSEGMESESQSEASEQLVENSTSSSSLELLSNQGSEEEEVVEVEEEEEELEAEAEELEAEEETGGDSGGGDGRGDSNGVGEKGFDPCENGEVELEVDIDGDDSEGGGAMGLGDSDLEMDMFSDGEPETGDALPAKDDLSASSVHSGDNESGGIGVEEGLVANLGSSEVSRLEGHYPVPESCQEFAGWVEGKAPADVGKIISKIRVGNHQELYAATKMKLEELYAIVVEHLGNLAEKAPEVPFAHMNASLSSLYDMGREVPWFAASAARKDLQSLQQKLVRDIQDAGKSGWPSNSAIVRLRLYSLLFPVSDRFHPVTSPLAILVNQYISQCSLERPRDLAIGLLLSKFAVRMASPANRYAFEPLALYSMALKEGIPGLGQDMLVVTGDEGTGKRDQSGPLTVERLFNISRKSKYFKSKTFKREGMRHALAGIREMASLHQKQICFPEIFSPVASVLEKLVCVDSLSGALRETSQKLLTSLHKTIRSTSRSRRPLVQKFRLEIPQVRQFNPRFEEDFSRVKEFEDDERVLKKKVDRERRGAMKELRKDAMFMARVRDVEKERLDKERAESEKRFYKELRAFEDDMRSGGQKGMNPHLKTRKRGKNK